MSPIPVASCPPEEELATYACGAVEEHRATQIDGHLSHCEHCLQRIGEIPAGADCLTASLQHQLETSPFEEEAKCREAVDKIEAIASQSTIELSKPNETPTPTAFLRDLLGPADRPGDLGRIGDYRVSAVLGVGGMGVVLKAEDVTLRRTIALKVMRYEAALKPHAKERFLREARAVAATSHPHVVSIHFVGEWRGRPYFVMPLLKGQSLAQRLKQGPPIDLREAITVARQAAEGLAAAHVQGLIHRDIKPDNIWLEETPYGLQVRLLDFGLARGDEMEQLTCTGAVVGTLHYMSPEQAEGLTLDERSDLFSLGCVLYEMLTGHLAFPGSSLFGILKALADQAPTPPVEVAPAVGLALSDLTLHLLEKAPERRPPSAAKVAEILKSFETDLNGAALESAASGRKSPWRVWPTLSVCIVMLAGGLVWAVSRVNDEPIESPDFSSAEAVKVLPPTNESSEYVAAPAPPSATLTQRDIAQWLLDAGASLNVDLGDEVRISVNNKTTLPKGDLRVRAITWDSNAKLPTFAPSDIERLSICKDVNAVWILNQNVSSTDWLTAFEHLTMLTFEKNSGSDAAIQGIGRLTDLRVLVFQCEGVTTDGFSFLSSLTNLTSLSVNNCPIGDEGLKHVANLMHLSMLSLWHSDLTDAGLVSLERLTRLVDVQLGYNRLDGSGLRHLASSDKLERLHLALNPLADENMHWIGLHHNLQSLSLRDTPISASGLEQAIAPLSKLQRLYVHRTGIDNSVLPSISRLSNLKELSVEQTNITKAAVNDLQGKMPNCKIYPLSSEQ